ncbi:hypothetical protein CSIM01_13088 [Colletotrichum simmondsii]|uniref:C2H2-type domain-containing protein n=1 Tax=Colletotrichum simmondsii TaxID=703756 RepID=A0A135SGT6_9PEZI|nr:hypothetical protein CSIM01_13088 [Colletotrichum simmondsii]
MEPMSSDYEDDGPAPTSRFATAGMNSLSRFEATAEADRRASKLYAKNLQQNMNAPGPERLLAMWSNRFYKFREVTLRVDDQIIRFLHTIPGKITGQGPDGRVSYQYVKGGVSHILKKLQFDYKNWSWTKHDSARIESTLRDLLHKDVLSREPCRGEKLWLTSDIVSKMTTKMIADADALGTFSWDFLLVKVLMILIPAAIGARSGDVTRSRLYTGTEYTKFSDVVIRLRDSDSQYGNELWGTITLPYTKTHKRDPTRNHAIEFVELMDPLNNAACVLKLILAHALRHGMVHGAHSWDQMMENLQKTKLITWVNPQRPLLCGSISGVAGKVNLDLPAPTDLMLRTLRGAAEAVGMRKKPIMHDLRRGAAHEQVHLPSTIRPTAMDSARRLLGHSHAANRSGVTELYTGHVAEPTWNLRLENKPAPRARMVVDFDEMPPAKRPRLSPSQVTAYCNQNDLDPNSTQHRKRAAYHLNAEHDGREPATGPSTPLAVASTSTDAENTGQLAPPKTRLSSRSLTKLCEDNQLDPNNKKDRIKASRMRNRQLERDHEIGASLEEAPVRTPLGPKDPNSAGPRIDSPAMDDEDDTLQPPPLHPPTEQEEDNSMINLLFSDPIPEEEVVSMLMGSSGEAAPKPTAAVYQQPRAFAKWLSQVNIVKWETIGAYGLPDSAVSGGSRDPPTRFIHLCPTEGCNETFLTHHGLERHLNRTHSEVIETIQCLDCHKKMRKGSLQKHHKEYHMEMTCPEKGCENRGIFHGTVELAAHKDQIHSGWINRGCPVKECNRFENDFKAIQNLVKHVKVSHPTFDLDELSHWTGIPIKKPASQTLPTWTPTRCPWQECSASLRVYNNRVTLLGHADRVHRAKAADVDNKLQALNGSGA